MGDVSKTIIPLQSKRRPFISRVLKNFDTNNINFSPGNILGSFQGIKKCNFYSFSLFFPLLFVVQIREFKEIKSIYFTKIFFLLFTFSALKKFSQKKIFLIKYKI